MVIMRLAITSLDKTIDSDFDHRFGRCNYFVVVDIKDDTMSLSNAVENPGKNQNHGAAFSAIQAIGNLEINALITGNLGPNAFNTLGELNIKAYHADVLKVRDAVELFMQNKLGEISSFGKSHQGMGRGFGRK